MAKTARGTVGKQLAAPAPAAVRSAADWWWLLPLAVAVVANLPGVSGELVWDDEFWNRQLAWFTSLATVLKPPAGIPDWPEGYFRPVATLSYLLDARLYGAASIAGRHVSNIVFHALATLGVWWLARRLLAGRPGAAVAAALAATLFAAHPIHTESVGWIGARVDVLATMFLLASVIAALAWRDRRSVPALLLAPVAYLFALGSKEVAIAGLALVPLTLLLAPGVPVRGTGELRVNSPVPRTGTVWGTVWIPLAIVYAAATLLYLELRHDAVSGFAPVLITGAPAYFVRAAAWYLIKLVLPWPQSNFVVWSMLPGLAAAAAVLLAGAALAAGAIAWLLRRRDGVPLLGLLWAGAALAPSLLLAVTTTAAAPVAERYLYLPSAGLALVAGSLLGAAWPTRWRSAALLAAGIAACGYLAGSIARSFDWSSNLRLWSSTTRQVTTHGLPWVELARAYYARNDDDDALRAYERARGLENTPGTVAVAEYNMGVIWLKRGALDDARQAFLRSRDAQSDYPLAHYGLGRVAYERGLRGGPVEARLDLFAQSRREFTEAARLSPGFGEPRLEITKVLLREGDAFAEAGRPDEAAARYKAGLDQLNMLIRAIPALLSQAGIADLRAELARKAAPR